MASGNITPFAHLFVVFVFVLRTGDSVERFPVDNHCRTVQVRRTVARPRGAGMVSGSALSRGPVPGTNPKAARGLASSATRRRLGAQPRRHRTTPCNAPDRQMLELP